MNDDQKTRDLYKALGKAENKEVLSKLLGMLEQDKELERAFFRNSDPDLMQYASAELKSDLSFFKDLAGEKSQSSKIQYASDAIKSNKEFGMLAVKCHGRNLYHLSDSLKEDKEVVMEAVKDFGRNVEFADPKFKDDKEIASIAVSNDAYSFPWFSDKLQNDPEIYEVAMSKSTAILKHCHGEIRDNREAVLFAAKSGDSEALRWASIRLAEDKEIALEVAKHGWGVSDAGPKILELCKDKDPVQALEAAIRMEKMQADLRPKQQPQKRGLKI